MIKKYWWVGLIVVFFVILFVQHMKINGLNDDNQIKSVELSVLRDSVFTMVTKNGELISKVNSIQIERGNLKESLETMGIDVKKLKSENVKLRTLNFALNAQLSSSGDVNTTTIDTFRIYNTDTIRYQKINDWTDGRLSLFNGTIENNNLLTDYRYNLAFKLLSNTEKKKTIITFVPEDPTNKTVLLNANSITIVHKKKWWEKWWFWTAIGTTGGYLIAK